MSKKRNTTNGIIYSTDPDFKPMDEETSQPSTLSPAEQKLRVLLDKKQRAGKAVTLIDGFQGSLDDLETVGKTLKTFCGTGGSVKDGLVIIQGDQREKVLQWLIKNGYRQTKKSG